MTLTKTQKAIIASAKCGMVGRKAAMAVKPALPKPQTKAAQTKKKKKKPLKKRSSGSKGTPFSYAENLSKSVGKINYRTTISGTDILYEVRTGATAPADALIQQVIPVNPRTLMPGSWLGQFAPLFQRFRFKRFNLRYKPIANVEYIGDVGVGYVADPNQEISGTGLTLMQAVTELGEENRVTGLCYEKCNLRLDPKQMVVAPGTKYSTNPDEEDDEVEAYQGRLFFITDNLTAANTLYGRWIVDWTIEFYNPITDKANNVVFAQFQSTPDPAQAHPWGTSWSLVYGDSSIVTMQTDATDNVLSFPLNGVYQVSAFYPGNGGAGLTATSVQGGTVTGVTSYINYCGAQVGKFWSYQFTATDGAIFTIHDTAGTHPTGVCAIKITRIAPGPNEPLVLSRKAMARQMKEFEQKIKYLMSIRPESSESIPSYPSFPGVQFPDNVQTATYATATITDGNGPPKQVVYESASSTSTGTISTAIAPQPNQQQQIKWSLIDGPPNVYQRTQH